MEQAEWCVHSTLLHPALPKEPLPLQVQPCTQFVYLIAGNRALGSSPREPGHEAAGAKAELMILLQQQPEKVSLSFPLSHPPPVYSGQYTPPQVLSELGTLL